MKCVIIEELLIIDISMTQQEIVDGLNAADAAQVAASQATTQAIAAAVAAVEALPTAGAPETPTEVDVKEPGGSTEVFTPEPPQG